MSRFPRAPCESITREEVRYSGATGAWPELRPRPHMRAAREEEEMDAPGSEPLSLLTLSLLLQYSTRTQTDDMACTSSCTQARAQSPPRCC